MHNLSIQTTSMTNLSKCIAGSSASCMSAYNKARDRLSCTSAYKHACIHQCLHLICNKLVPHLLAKQPLPLLQPGNDSGPCNGKGPLCIFLYFSVGVTHLGNEQVQQDHNHAKQESQVQDNREPPGEEEGGRGSLKGAG